MSFPTDIISVGPPPLTVYASDCALSVIDFMAAVVRGVDLIDVNPETVENWHSYLATYYPMLAPVDRYWFASAPYTLGNLQAMWPQTPEPAREMYRQSWAVTLPAMLQFIDPVLRASHHEAQQSMAQLMGNMVQQQRSAPPAVDPQAQAHRELYNHHVNAVNLQNFSTSMAASTINLMHAMSGRR